MTTTLSPESPSSESEPRVADMTPVELWRHPCRVLDQLYVSGDLPIRSAEFDAQLDQWIDEGITHIVDLRGEHSDADRVADRHPHVTYVWLGTHDDGDVPGSLNRVEAKRTASTKELGRVRDRQNALEAEPESTDLVARFG